MNTPATLQFFSLTQRQGKKMAYRQWGDPKAAHLVVCVHGLTRQGLDFAVLAEALLQQAQLQGQTLRVISVDILGRGKSDWLDDSNGNQADGPSGYSIPHYTQDMAALLAHLYQQSAYQRLDWVGTSMGGLIGMSVLGANELGLLALPIPTQRLVLNDVGPVLEWEALLRIQSYLGKHSAGIGLWSSPAAAADAMWQISSHFGPHSDEEWLALSLPQMKLCADGRYTFHYDPAIAVPFATLTQASNQGTQATLWHLYENISAQTLITRGQQSDLLSLSTVNEMLTRGYKMSKPAKCIEFAGVGHAPTFVAQEQSAAVVDFLLSA